MASSHIAVEFYQNIILQHNIVIQCGTSASAPRCAFREN